MPVVWDVLELVVPTMESVAVDVSMDPGAPELPVPVLLKTVDMPAPAAPMSFAGRAVPALAVAPMAATAFAVAVAPAAALRPAPAPATPVAMPVALPVALAEPDAPAVPAVGPSSSEAMV